MIPYAVNCPREHSPEPIGVGAVPVGGGSSWVLFHAYRRRGRHEFTRSSFSGAYGHLIHAIAQYQLRKQGKRDWVAKRQVRVEPPASLGP
jgi:hypothetical protein